MGTSNISVGASGWEGLHCSFHWYDWCDCYQFTIICSIGILLVKFNLYRVFENFPQLLW